MGWDGPRQKYAMNYGCSAVDDGPGGNKGPRDIITKFRPRGWQRQHNVSETFFFTDRHARGRDLLQNCKALLSD